MGNNVLGAPQFIDIASVLTQEEVTVLGGLLRSSGVNCVSFLKDLLRGSPFLNEAGEPGFRVGPLGGLCELVEGKAPSESADGDIETAL